MTFDPNNLQIKFEYPVFPEHTIPKGMLPKDLRAQACWWFYVRAHRILEEVGDSIDDQYVLEGELWHDTHFVQMKRNTAMQYGLESAVEMDKMWKYVRAEANLCGLPMPDPRYVNASPGKDN